jgi:hypothetical protein
MDLSDISDISVPANWYVVEVDPTVRRERATKDVAARLASQPELGPYEETIVEALVGFGEDAEERGAMSCAVLWEPSPYGPVVANLMVLLAEPSATTLPAEVEGLIELLSTASDTDVGVRAVATIDLPAGPAVRARYLREADEEGAPRVVFDVTQFWIPLLSRKTDPVTLIVNAVTPSLHAGDRVAEAARRTAESVLLCA